VPHPIVTPRLFLSHDRALHRLVAVEFGRTAEDQPPGHRVELGDSGLTVLLDAPGGRTVGFVVEAFDTFDPDAPSVEMIWGGPRLDAPSLGLTTATVGEIVVAARRRHGGRHSVDRTLAAMATACDGPEAVARWTHCLDAGDMTAHREVGRALLELDRPAEAYAHLRHYVSIAPHGAWAWNLLGRAAEAIGQTGEARHAYGRAIDLAPPAGDAGRRDAEERLAGLEERGTKEHRTAGSRAEDPRRGA
jgi:tetratricopeptide (TPR) repeat protein